MTSLTRTALSQDTTYYVNGLTGSNTNDGLTALTAFADPQFAWNFLRDKVDLAGFKATVLVQGGCAYPQGLLCSGTLLGQKEQRSVQFLGIGAPTLPVLGGNSVSNALHASNGAAVCAGGFNTKVAAGGDNIGAGWDGRLCIVGYMVVGLNDVGAIPHHHFDARHRGEIVFDIPDGPTHEVWSNAWCHFSADDHSTIRGRFGISIQPATGVRFDYSFANASGNSLIRAEEGSAFAGTIFGLAAVGPLVEGALPVTQS